MLANIFILFFSAAIALAGPITLVRRVVFNPLITYPTAGVQWSSGSKHNVTWSTAGAPSDYPLNNATGMLVLGHLTDDSENLDLNNPLATGFLIKDESVWITVPDVEPREDYIVVLFGDSGNASPEFSITNVTIATPSSSSSTSTTSSTATSTSTSSSSSTTDSTSAVTTSTLPAPDAASSATTSTTSDSSSTSGVSTSTSISTVTSPTSTLPISSTSSTSSSSPSEGSNLTNAAAPKRLSVVLPLVAGALWALYL
ncbi:hypothetical protein SISSUDRAFT_991780 [Sistotremastrum suecicum HHB10207 ss-3]|uniref:Ser-Thr-rich glycosyl-phosphatidyl-inositol-anchored membrane family-domain-containing protein n=1 Tax=Sistotremastrum suecicum HHB10207 ss-3 TaxID=1314776 RepID=A0A165ZNG2_9AGAM|nr:hypothetical protein SISSUDRAFT_991780 [Sistotremastrum suecicum HHB10207 ss-3]